MRGSAKGLVTCSGYGDRNEADACDEVPDEESRGGSGGGRESSDILVKAEACPRILLLLCELRDLK